MSIFTEISLILVVVLTVSVVMRMLKQPLIIGYILTGILVGPYALNILHATDVIEVFSQLGISALLFIVGLGLNPKLIRELGGVSLITGVGQVVFTSLFGYGIALALGFSSIASLYIAVALTFSSTIIILKLLSDRGDVNKLYGRIAIGFLLVQDVLATIALITITSITSLQSNNSVIAEISFLLLKGVLPVIVLFAIANYLLPKLENFIGKSQEFLFVAALAWGLGISALYAYLNLSLEIGALVAGVSLSMTPYAHEVSSRLRPLRDFFIILFFILLGNHMVLENWQNLVLPTVLFSSFILIGNPLIVFLLLNLLGYSKRVGFFAGLTVAQISEFSLILVALGSSVGHLDQSTVSLVTLVGIVTIASSTYLVLYADTLYKWLSPLLSYLEIRRTKRVLEKSDAVFDAILFGYRRVGPEFARAFQNTKMSHLVVDFNPATISKLKKLQVPCEYGDAGDLEFLQELPLSSAKLIVSTVPDFVTNELLVKTVRNVSPEAIVLILADNLDQADALYRAGATHVIMPHYLGASFAAEMIIKNKFNKDQYQNIWQSHLGSGKNAYEVFVDTVQ
jgi:Kef-type K+ transport system membrane component KefB